MASTKYTGKFKRGQRVRYRFFSAAMSCQSSRKIKGSGKITGIEQAEGTTMYVIDNDLLVFERELSASAT